MRLSDIISDFWNEASLPSVEDESVYMFVLIAVGHIFLGSVFAVFLSGLWLILIPIIYFIIKETRDLMKGGSVSDSLADVFFVGVGAFYLLITPWGPLIAALIVAVTTWAKYSRK